MFINNTIISPLQQFRSGWALDMMMHASGALTYPKLMSIRHLWREKEIFSSAWPNHTHTTQKCISPISPYLLSNSFIWDRHCFLPTIDQWSSEIHLWCWNYDDFVAVRDYSKFLCRLCCMQHRKISTYFVGRPPFWVQNQNHLFWPLWIFFPYSPPKRYGKFSINSD